MPKTKSIDDDTAREAAIRDAAADDDVARDLRGFGPIGMLAILAILAGNFIVLPLSAVLVLLWTWRSRTPWRDIGFVRPNSWTLAIVVGVVFGVAFKLVMKAVVMPLLGAPPANEAYHYLAGNTAALPAMVYAVVIGAGFGEETVYRGYLFERIGKRFGPGAAARIGAVLFTAVLFGLAHYAVQGVPGLEQATIFGLLFGAIYAWRGQLFMLMIAHAAFDVTALALIYWDVEAIVAQFFFH